MVGQVSPRVQVGIITDNLRGTSFTIYNDFFIEQIGNPLNNGFAVRDPSGFMFLMIPSTTPHINAFFVNWTNEIVEINNVTGARIVGYCQCPPPPLNPYAGIFNPPTYNTNVGVLTPSGFRPLPNDLIDTQHPYGRI